MNREQIIDWAQQLQVMLQQLGEMRQQVNQGKAFKSVLETQGDVERALKVAREIATLEQNLQTSSQAALRKCKRDTLDACEVLVKDVVERMRLSEQAFETSRRLMAELDLELALTPELEDRSARQDAIAKEKQRSEAALKLAAELIPAPGVVLL